MESGLLAAELGGMVGLVLGITGAGGGTVAVPLLVFGLHLTLHQAAPVGLIAVGLAAGLGTVLGLRDGIVRYRAVLLMGGMGMIAAPLGVRLAQDVSNEVLTMGFAVVMTLIAWRAWQRAAETGTDTVGRPCLLNRLSGRLNWTLPCARVLALTGVVAGLLSGMLGAGGGFIIVPALKRNTDLSAHGILATSLGVIALVSISSVAAGVMQGNVDWAIALPFGAGTVLALLAGRQLAKHVQGVWLFRAFAVLCGVVAVMMFAKGSGWLVW